MCIHYIEAEIELDTEGNLYQQVSQTLETYGEPLRWAIVAIEAQQARIEAVVLTP